MIPIKDPAHQGQLDTEFITEIDNNEERVQYAICRDHDVIIAQIHELKDTETGQVTKATEANLCSISELVFNRLVEQYLAKVGMVARVDGQMIIKNLDPARLHTPTPAGK